MTSQVSSADREALLSTVVAAMDEMAAGAKAAEKRANGSGAAGIGAGKRQRRATALIGWWAIQPFAGPYEPIGLGNARPVVNAPPPNCNNLPHIAPPSAREGFLN
jgi:hypothetical protein